MIVLYFGIIKIGHLVKRDNPTVLKTSFFRDMDTTDPFRPQDLGFSIAFGTNDLMDPSIAYFTANAVTLSNQIDSSGKSFQSKTLRRLSIDTCGLENFNLPSSDITKYGIEDYMCVTDNDYQLQGLFYSDTYQYLEIKMWKCQNDSDGNSSTYDPNIVC